MNVSYNVIVHQVGHLPKGASTTTTTTTTTTTNTTTSTTLPCRSQWPSGLRRGSAAVRLLRLWVRIPLGA